MLFYLTQVVLHGLYASDHNQQLTFDRPVGAVAIDPNFYRSGSGRRFMTGIDKVVLHEKGFLSRYRTTILHQGEGLVRNIAWKGRFAAWATDLVRHWSTAGHVPAFCGHMMPVTIVPCCLEHCSIPCI
ncbi:hypothetical protein V5799_027899 [Amblyomma americanum]|uniref:Vps41 beta-propeller domain-containing protein n=1 Tax=Amblyomma americanum TaxID=6943 RepID=A0AAQ4DEE7_AMBAM